MTTYTLTVSTSTIGLGVLSGARVTVERKRTVVSDLFGGQALSKNTASTNSSGIATILLEPDDGTVYHEVKVFDLSGVLAYSKIIIMPPQNISIASLPVPDLVSESAARAEVAAEVAEVAEAATTQLKEDVIELKSNIEQLKTDTESIKSETEVFKNEAEDAATNANESALIATTSKALAETYKDQAAASAAAAAIAAEIKPDTATGIADTVDGEYFWVVSAESSAAARLYRNELGVAVDTGKSVSNGEILDFSIPYRSCLPPTVEEAAFEFVDSAGKRGIAILNDGSLSLKTVKMEIPNIYYRPIGYIFDIAGTDGKRVLAIDSDGAVFLKMSQKALDILKSQLSLSAPVVTNITMSSLSGGYRTSGYVFDIADEGGNRVFAVTNQGRVFLKLSSTALDLLSSQLSVYQPTAWRGSVNVEDILATDKLVSAKIEDTATVPNWYGDIVMPREGSTLCAIAKGTGRLQLYLYVGQSNSQASGVDDSILVEQRFPYHALKYVAGSMSDGASAIDINTLNDIVATQDFQRPYPHNSAAMSSLYRSRIIGETADPILGRADGKGGAPLSDFLKTASPSYCYDNAMTTVEASYDIAKSYGMDLDVTIVFVQGENSGTSGSGTSIATYQGWLSTLLNDYVTDVKAIINRIPKIIIWQTNGLTDGTNDQKNGALAHLAETILRRGTSCVLAAPMYQCPISDTIHGTSIARMMQGEITDLVIREIKRTGSWIPLDLARNPDGTAKLTRVGTTITGKFNRPVLIDNDWIPTVGANLGFYYTGSGGISSVSITDGSPDFTVTLANSVGGVLSYASRNCDATYYETGGASGENWSAPRGMIYANSGVESVWYQLGYTVPRFIRHYLVRFEETIV